MSEREARLPLKWPGSKSRLVGDVRKEFGRECQGVYHEPFTGSGAVFFHLAELDLIGESILGDINPRLINFHKALRNNPEGFLSALGQYPRDDTYPSRYYGERDLYNDPEVTKTDPVGQAARLAWLNRCCFNGLYRENRSGQFNVSVGAYKRPRIPPDDVYRNASQLLHRAALQVADFSSALKRVVDLGGERTGDWVYCDPPYLPLTDSADFVSYSSDGFGLDQHRELSRLATELASRGARVVVSNHDLPICREELYPASKGWEISNLTVYRPISRSKDRAHVGEILASIGPRDP